MRSFKKIIPFLLIFVTVLGVTIAFSGCSKKVEPDSESGMIIVTKDVFKKNIKVSGGKLSPFSVNALKEYDVDFIAEDEYYYALVYVKAETLYGMSVKVHGASFVDETNLYVYSNKHSADVLDIRQEISSVYNYGIPDEELYGSQEYIDSLYSEAVITVEDDSISADYYVAVEFRGGRVVSDTIDVRVETYQGYQTETLLLTTKESSHSKYAKAVSSVKYLSETDYLSGNFDGKLKDSISMTAGERYFAVIDYVLSSPVGITAADTARIHVDVYDAGAVGDGGMINESNNFIFDVEELPTSQYEKGGTSIDAEFTLQLSETGEKRYRFIVSVVPVSTCDVKIKAHLSGDGISFLYGGRAEGSMSGGAIEEIEREFEYQLSGDKSYYIVVGLGGEGSDTVTVPATYNGKPVKEIADETFSYVTYLKEVRISSGIQKIGKNAFKGCTGLKFIVIPSSVTVISQNAFDDCNLKLYFVGKALPATFESGWNPEGLTCYYDCKNESGPLTFTLNSDGLSYTVSGGDCGGSRIIIPAVHENYPVTRIAKGLKNFSGITVHESVTSVDGNALSNTVALTYANIPSSLISAIKKDSVQTLIVNSGTYVPNAAFRGYKALTSLTLADSITEIKDSAFYNCTALESIELGGVTKIGASAFAYCSVKSLNLSGSVKTVGELAFAYCTKLSSVVIGDNVTVIGNGVFYGCRSLAQLTIGKGITTIPSTAFYGVKALNTLTVPQNVGSIGDSAFEECTGLVSVRFEGSTPSIGASAFEGCYCLIEVLTTSGRRPVAGSIEQGRVAQYAMRVATVSDGSAIDNRNGFLFFTLSSSDITVAPKYYLVKYTGAGGDITLPSDYNGKNYAVYPRAFYANEVITGVTVNGKITEIGEYAFSDCIKLTDVKIIGDTETVSRYAFSGCSALTHLNVGGSTKTISEYAFYSCNNLITLKLGNAVKTVGDRAFSGCTSLASITFGTTLLEASVDHIGEYAFYNCNKLSGVLQLPGDVTYIGSYAFGQCSKITEFKLGALVETVGVGAFEGCSALEKITVNEYNLDYKTVDGVLYYVKTEKTLVKYPEGKTLKCFSVPNDVKAIGENAFYGSSLRSVTVPDGVTRIGKSAFGANTALSVIEIGKDVAEIGTNAFSSCEKLYTVINRSSLTLTVGSTDNGRIAYYAKNVVKEGTLYESGDYVFIKNGSDHTLICYNGNSTNITLPSSIGGVGYKIGSYAFYDNDLIIRVTVSSGVTEIQPYAFVGCDDLNAVVFENTSGWYAYSATDPTQKYSLSLSDSQRVVYYLTNAEGVSGNRAYGNCTWKYEG